jgi:anti-sigma factor RsiW
MTRADDNQMAGMADDDALTAYLDGELDEPVRAALEARMLAEPALKSRLEQLARGGRPFGAAYAALLAAAPQDRLTAGLNAAIAGHRAHAERRNWQRVAMAIAAALVIFVAGGATGYLVLPQFNPPTPLPGWRQVVAEYQGLMTTDTLEAIPDDPNAVAAELAAAGGKLAVDLTADKLALPDAELKRAEILEFRGKPLVQLAYLADAEPVALCIIANGQPNKATDFEMREGFNIVFWTDDGRGYMLIGKLPRDKLEAYAGTLQPKV